MKSSTEAKILATLGPASLDGPTIRAMDAAGVDIFRVNLSHTAVADLEQIVQHIRSCTPKPICLDTEGAQIRTGRFDGGAVALATAMSVQLVDSAIVGSEDVIPLYPIDPSELLNIGDVLSLDFNSVVVQVIERNSGRATARVLQGGKIGSNKGVGIDRSIELAPFTAKDLASMKIARKLHIDHFALSFASAAQNISALRLMYDYPVVVISKIESLRGIWNLLEIATASDALLIDRGDLSREVPIQKIGAAQKFILDAGKAHDVPVYVATNLLDSMMHSLHPSRAEVNDMTASLFAGSAGLVLAAETAIGSHPVEAVRMAADIIRATRLYADVTNIDSFESFLVTDPHHDLIEPHGGQLVHNVLHDTSSIYADLKRIKVDERTLLDVFQVGHGTYSPLKGFMNASELASVLSELRLPSGDVWTLPILFQFHKHEISFSEGQAILLARDDIESPSAIMNVDRIERIDLDRIAQKWFGTLDNQHPGVALFLSRGEFIVSGEVFCLPEERRQRMPNVLTPTQSRSMLAQMGAGAIVGFHTRNVLHRAHEFIQKEALRRVHGNVLFLSPVLGPKRVGDFRGQVVLKTYETVIRNGHYAPFKTLIGAFCTYSRFSGPREAVFTALCRKNLGCTHFIVGRDHTGVGEYYNPYASQDIFDEVGDIGIQPLLFDTAYHCVERDSVRMSCDQDGHTHKPISATEIRRHLLQTGTLPKYLVREEVAEMLETMLRDKENIFEE